MYNYFNVDEFKCKCGCEQNKISSDLIHLLDAARKIAGIPFKINSGYRCHKQNKDVGGSFTSSHLKGLAADIKCTKDKDRFKIEKSLYDVGFKRIGTSKTFIHVDIDKDKNQYRKWNY